MFCFFYNRGAVRRPALRHWCGGRGGTHRGSRSQTSSLSTRKIVGTRRTSTSSDPRYKLPSASARFSISRSRARTAKRMKATINGGRSLVWWNPFCCPLEGVLPHLIVIQLLFIFIGFKCYVKKKKFSSLLLSIVTFTFLIVFIKLKL